MTKTKHTGSCHCGKVGYDVQLDLTKEVMSCNCSICSKRGHLLSFASAEDFTIIKGEEHLQDYLFYKKNIHHLFCKTCGISSFARGTNKDGSAMYAINVRCLDGIEIDKLKVQQVNGKDF
jgi:hypothetical protein